MKQNLRVLVLFAQLFTVWEKFWNWFAWWQSRFSAVQSQENIRPLIFLIFFLPFHFLCGNLRVKNRSDRAASDPACFVMPLRLCMHAWRPRFWQSCEYLYIYCFQLVCCWFSMMETISAPHVSHKACSLCPHSMLQHTGTQCAFIPSAPGMSYVCKRQSDFFSFFLYKHWYAWPFILLYLWNMPPFFFLSLAACSNPNQNINLI